MTISNNKQAPEFFIRDINGSYQALNPNEIIEAAKSLLSAKFKRGIQITNALCVKEHLRVQLAPLEHEVFYAVWLDNQHRIIAEEELFRGTIDAASIFPREVVKMALSHNAAKVIFAHNHPSGDAEPSSSDEYITKRLIDALSLIDVKVLDHIIIGEHIVSFAQRGMI